MGGRSTHTSARGTPGLSSRYRSNWLSHRVWDTYEAILDACCEAWNALMAKSEVITSIGIRPNLRYDYLASNGRLYRPHINGWKVSIDVMKQLDRQNRLFFAAKEDARLRKMGYPTQKPIALLERIVSISSNPGDIVLDPFCGCGTTIHAAQKLKRQWIGIDVTHLPIALVERRLKEAFAGIAFEVRGVPKDVAGARNLAERDKHEFQKWITGKIGAQPYKGGQKGMDRGIDGYLHFRDADKKPQFAIVSVKGGENVNSGMVRDLKGTMEREKAALGLFLMLNKPTREMEREAASAGIYETGGMKVDASINATILRG